MMGLYCGPRREYTTARLTVLSEALDRFKEEHGELDRLLIELEDRAVKLEQAREPAHELRMLLHLRLWTLGFMEELDRHSNWEERELFPFLHEYFQRETPPSVIPSFEMLEKDHELAEEYLRTFLRAVHAVKSNSGPLPVHQAAACLIQACRALREHLSKEEQLVLPLTEKVLADLDYLFS